MEEAGNHHTLETLLEDEPIPLVVDVERLFEKDPISQGQLMLMRLESYFKESKDDIAGENINFRNLILRLTYHMSSFKIH